MNTPLSFLRTHNVLGWLFGILLIAAPLLCMAQTVSSDPPYSVVERGPFYNVLQRTVSVTNAVTGVVTQQIQSYTELGDGMNFLSNGVWSAAQDLIEVTSTGAEAVHGQMVAGFNGDITSTGAISLTNAAGEVFQSHPIGLFYADSASGKLAQIGSVQSSVGTLYPPNVIVFSNVLSGLTADLMLVWAKNGFEQNLVLKKSPPIPESLGLSSSSTTLQLWTAMDSCPVPQEQRPVVLDSELVDHILIFKNSWFPVGAAFSFGNTPLPSSGQAAQVGPVRPGETGTIPTAKSLVNIAGQQVLIEEVRYSDLAAILNQLPQASLWSTPNQAVELPDRARFLVPPPKTASASRPMQVASAPYSLKGVVLDYTTLSGSTNSYTFTNGTYYIPSSFSVGPNTVTFQANACLKFGSAWLIAYGPLSFPSSGHAVFTSKDDNSYGQIITNSTANPQYAAGEALWIYYPTFSTTVRNALFRWANRAIEYDENVGDHYGHTLASSVFQDCNIGVYMNMQSDTLTLASDSYCNVVTPVQTDQYHGTVSGSMTYDCGVVSVAMVNDPNRDLYGYDTNKNSQTECSFAVLDSTNIVAAFMSTHLTQFGLGDNPGPFPGIPSPRMATWAVSRNGGTNFTDNGPVPPVSTITNGSTIITNGAPNATLGDAGDTVMTYDPGSNIVYLLTNPSRETGFQGFRLWQSKDKGTNFTSINTNVPGPGTVSAVDKPMIRVNPSNHALYVAGSVLGRNTWAAYSTNGGNSWTNYRSLDTGGTDSRGADIVILPDNTVYVFWLQSTAGSTIYTNYIRYALLSTNGNWGSASNFGPQLTSTNIDGKGQLLRFNGDDANDWFSADSFPRVTYANSHIYVVYRDAASPPSTTDRGDIFLMEASVNWSDHTLSLNSGPRKINNDATQTDQWNPSIAANPSGTSLFIGYYSRQNDPTTNSWIMAYGAKGIITNGLSLATFDCFPLSSTSFLPLFAGTYATSNNVWTFDPVFAPSGVCLDTNAVPDGSGNAITCPSWPNGASAVSDYTYVNFCADDYTWSASDSNYFYFAWSDRSRTNGTPPYTRPDADIRLAKIKQ